jgi:formamidopyrimidine-DNA glycosylase
MHLGMSGRFTIHPPHGQPLTLGDYDDEDAPASPATAPSGTITSPSCSMTAPASSIPILAASASWTSSIPRLHRATGSSVRWGPEPLGNDFNAEYLRSVLARRRTPLKSALLDQRVVAGLGNIYASEALHRAALSPKRIAATLTRGRLGEAAARGAGPGGARRAE